MSEPVQIETADEGLDPRIQEELERLNAASDEINKLEAELDEARALFRQTLTESTQKLNLLSKKMGKSVQKARPYYEAKKLARQAQIEAQKAAVEYQRANGIHRAARETISLAEQRLFSDADEKRQFDSAWQEMLNHATMKVMEAEQMRSKSEHDHQQKAAAYTTANQKLQQLEKSLKKVITKTKPYFDVKTSFELQLLQQKQNVEDLQKAVSAAKVKYREALKNLESISDEIHHNRQLLKEPRSAGVGAEADGDDLPEINLDDMDSYSQYSDLDDGNSLDTDSTADDASMIAQTDDASLSRRERGGSFTSHSSISESSAAAICPQDVASVKTVQEGSSTEGTATVVHVQAVEGGLAEEATAVENNMSNTEGGCTQAGMATCRQDELKGIEEPKTETENTKEDSQITSQSDGIYDIEANIADKEDKNVQHGSNDDVEKAFEDESTRNVSECTEPTLTATQPDILEQGVGVHTENVEEHSTSNKVAEVESDSVPTPQHRGNEETIKEVGVRDTGTPGDVELEECKDEATKDEVEQGTASAEHSTDRADERKETTFVTHIAEKETGEGYQVAGPSEREKHTGDSTGVSSVVSQKASVTDSTTEVILKTSLEEKWSDGFSVVGHRSEASEGRQETSDQNIETANCHGRGDAPDNVAKAGQEQEKQNLLRLRKSVEEMTAEEIDELEDTYL